MNVCPACGKEVKEGEPHVGVAFDLQSSIPQLKWKRFWLCHESVVLFEGMVRKFRATGFGEFMAVPPVADPNAHLKAKNFMAQMQASQNMKWTGNTCFVCGGDLKVTKRGPFPEARMQAGVCLKCGAEVEVLEG